MADAEHDDSCYAEYEKERGRLAQNEFEAYRDFDKWIITVAGSTLALSVAFLKDVVPFSRATYKSLVCLGWTFFFLSLIVSMVSLLSAAIAHGKYRDCLDEEGKRGFGSDYLERVTKRQSEMQSSALTMCLNIAALTLFGVGMVLTVSFAAVNLL